MSGSTATSGSCMHRCNHARRATPAVPWGKSVLPQPHDTLQTTATCMASCSVHLLQHRAASRQRVQLLWRASHVVKAQQLATDDTDGGRDVAQPLFWPLGHTHSSQMCIQTCPTLSAMVPSVTWHGPSPDHTFRLTTSSRTCVVLPLSTQQPSPSQPRLRCDARPSYHPPTP